MMFPTLVMRNLEMLQNEPEIDVVNINFSSFAMTNYLFA